MNKFLVSCPIIALCSTAYALDNQPKLNTQEMRSLSSLGYITGGGVSGNEKIGLNCLTPTPNAMGKCLSYKNMDGRFELDPDLPRKEISINFDDLDRALLFKEFNGYPFVVKRESFDGNLGTCQMDNPFVSTLTYNTETNELEPLEYQCDTSGEYFNQQEIDNLFWHSFSFSEANQAHFFAGLTLQMFYKYYNELFPNDYQNNILGPQCQDNKSFCIKQLKQVIDARGLPNTAGGRWDGEYVLYPLGNFDNYSWSTMDMVSHEITHAITEWNNPELGETKNSTTARMLKEALSDIASSALKDYFKKNISGSYSSSQIFQQQTEDKKWWLAWDSTFAGFFGESDRGLRYFHWPSWDGKSINDLRDTSDWPSNGYYRGGPIRKFYYLLIEKIGWEHSDALKLFLLGNKNCIAPSTDFVDLGDCLISQVNSVFQYRNTIMEGLGSIRDLELQVEKAFHTVGIFPNNSSLMPLEVKTNKNYSSLSYKIKNNFNLQTVDTINIDWGDGTGIITWQKSQSGKSIEEFLNGQHLYENNVSASRLSIDLILNSGKNYYYSKDFHLVGDACTPRITNKDQEIQSIELLGKVFDGDESGYTIIDASQLNLSDQFNSGIKIQGQFFEGNISYYIDKNRNDIFEPEELMPSDSYSNIDEGFQFSLTELHNLNEGLIKARIIISKESNITPCEEISGSAVDIILKTTPNDVPPSSDFTYKQTGDKTIEFSATQSPNDSQKGAQYEWFYKNNREIITIGNEKKIEFTFENYDSYEVFLTASSENGVSSTSSQIISIEKPKPSYCEPNLSTNHPKGFFIESFGVNSVHEHTKIGLTEANKNSPEKSNYKGYEYSKILRHLDKGINTDIEQYIFIRSNAYTALNQDVNLTRAVLWIDYNNNGEFEASEASISKLEDNELARSHGQRYCTSISRCTLNTQISFLAQKAGIIDSNGVTGLFRARLKLKKFNSIYGAINDSNLIKSACSPTKKGETLDFYVAIGEVDDFF